MGCIAKDCKRDIVNFFVKGAPEKIVELCIPSSVPENFKPKLNELT